jgi:starch synthase
MKNVLFVGSESVPFIKTGGLADVCGALPKCFYKPDWDVRVVIPKYSSIPERWTSKFEYVTHFYMRASLQMPEMYVGVEKYVHEGVTFYFIDNQDYFTGWNPYGDPLWDLEKFIFFDKAVLSMLPLIDFRPDIIHCHDWQTGYIPVYLKNEFAAGPFYQGIKSIMTIHNLKFQGIWDVKSMMAFSGFPKSLFTPDKLEFHMAGNMLKGGLVYADYITTVSETYAQEIQTTEYGEGLNGLLQNRHMDMQGILNGIDWESYDPETDVQIYNKFKLSNWRQLKKKNKQALQKDLGLTEGPQKFMIGLVSRLTDQKGLDLVNEIMDSLCDEFTQLVVIGTGEVQYENTFRHFAWKYPERVSANILYDETLARKLYAAADAFLVPSRFEPCGLTQMISMRYGTIPIVRETGGLADTVPAYNDYEDSGLGFSFQNYSAKELMDSINYAKTVYFERKRDWNRIVDRALQADNSWESSTFKYEGLYRYLLGMI